MSRGKSIQYVVIFGNEVERDKKSGPATPQMGITKTKGEQQLILGAKVGKGSYTMYPNPTARRYSFF